MRQEFPVLVDVVMGWLLLKHVKVVAVRHGETTLWQQPICMQLSKRQPVTFNSRTFVLYSSKEQRYPHPLRNFSSPLDLLGIYRTCLFAMSRETLICVRGCEGKDIAELWLRPPVSWKRFDLTEEVHLVIARSSAFPLCARLWVALEPLDKTGQHMRQQDKTGTQITAAS